MEVGVNRIWQKLVVGFFFLGNWELWGPRTGCENLPIDMFVEVSIICGNKGAGIRVMAGLEGCLSRILRWL